MEMIDTVQPKPINRAKFIVGGLLIVAAVIYLIMSSSQSYGQYFLTIEELKSKGNNIAGEDVRISGAVLGDSIQYDSENIILTFTVVNIPGDNNEIEAQGGLAKVLHMAVNDPSRARIQVVYNQVKPDLLRDEAQAIMTGKMGEDGIFYANELLLKCPTKYEESLPEQSGG